MKKKFLVSLTFALIMVIAWGCLFLKFISALGFPDGSAFFYSFAYAFGHAFEFGFVCLVIFLVFSVLPKKIHAVLSVAMVVFISSFLLADYIVFKQFRLHIDGGILSMFFGEGAGDIFIFPASTYVQAVLGFVVLLFVIILFWIIAMFLNKRFLSKYLRKSLVLLYLCVFVLLLVYHGVYAWAAFKLYHPVAYQISALPLSYPLTMNRYLSKKGFNVPDSVPNITSKLISYPLAPVELGEHQNLNVVVIMIDSWRFDAVTEDITPNITEFSKQAVRFTNHNAGSNHTKHGLYTFFYGIPGSYWANILSDRISPVLIDTFLRENYETGIYASATLVSPEFNRTIFVNIPDLQTSTPGATAPDRDLRITERFIDFIKTRNETRPFFSFLFYDSSHAIEFNEEIYPPKFTPYEGKNYISNEPENAWKYFNKYKNAVGFIDVLIKRVLDTLETQDLLKNTIVIITGDHGDEFNDLGDGYWGHNGNYSKYQTKVPFIMYWPGMEPHDITYATSHMDAVPTLMQAMFHTTADAEAYTTGTNLFLPDRSFIYMHGASDSYAIIKDGVITVFPVFGAVHAFDEETYRPVKSSFSMDAWREIMQILSRFKK